MNRQNDQKTVVVLGLARSGTSVVTGLLKIIGVDMGESTYDKANPFGSFEDKDFAELHKRIFDLSGKEKSYWNPPDREAIEALNRELSPMIQEFIGRKSQGKQLWGWKHPRTILTIDLFFPYLMDPHFVVVFRDPLAIAKSAVEHTKNYKSGKVDVFHALKLANFYYAEMLKVLEKHQHVPTVLVSYGDVVQQPVKETRRIAQFLALPLRENAIPEIEKLVIPRDLLTREGIKGSGFFGAKLPRLIKKSWRP